MKKVIDFTEVEDGSKLVGVPTKDIELIHKQNEALGRHLFEYFQEVCDIQNVDRRRRRRRRKNRRRD